MTSVVIHYKELALKGKNRPWFIRILVRNLQSALAGLHVKSVRSSMGRLELEAGDDTPMDELRARISRVFGIANFSVASHVPFGPQSEIAPQSEIRHPQFFDRIASAVLADLAEREVGTFRVSATRSDKRLPFTSPVIEREVGGRIKEAKGWKVQLDDPEMTIRLEMLSHEAFYFFDKEPGAGGMPSGTGGRVACLLSGGLDSPVAAFRMMRRGCSVLFIHFHSYPILSRASQEKVREIAALLTRHQLRSRLVLVPFGELQQQVVLSAPPELRVVLYRRLMLRIAERIARRWRARALVTGDVIGQVASQTLENMTAIADVATMEILRPLVGMDKDEIIAESKRIGTYPISIIPDQDCCTLFTPRHPATRARVPIVLQAESALAIEDMVAAATAASVMEDFKYPR